MAKNSGSGSRTGSVSARTQVKNPVMGDFVRRDEAEASLDDSVISAVMGLTDS